MSAIIYQTVRKSYRRLAFATLNGQPVGHVGWCPAAVRNRKAGLTPNNPSAGMYSAFARDGRTKLGEAATLAGAKKLLAASL